MRLERQETYCALEGCQWCARVDWPCRFCAGAGRWHPERPQRDADGLIVWARVDEPCRMCAGTGKEHNPLPAAPSRP
nr:hypothetical protein [Nocardiopsis ansamitocini]